MKILWFYYKKTFNKIKKLLIMESAGSVWDR